MTSLSRQKLVDFVESMEELGWEFIVCVLGEEVNGVTKPLSFVSANVESQDNLMEMLNLLKEEAKGPFGNTKTNMELHIYDFDQTLFWSPFKPMDMDHDEWWPISLSPPFVPKRPSNNWWNLEIVEKAKQSLSDPNVMAILATGRTWDFFVRRVRDLLDQQGLNFTHIYLTDPKIPTKYYKSKIFKSLDNIFDFDAVHIWDDRNDYFSHYTSLFDVPVTCHHITRYDPMSVRSHLIRKAYENKDLRPFILEILKKSHSVTDPIDIVVPLENALRKVHSELINGREGRLIYLRKVLLQTVKLIESFFSKRGMRVASQSQNFNLKEIVGPQSPENNIVPDMIYQKVTAYRDLISNLQQIIQWGQTQAWRTVIYKDSSLDRVSKETLETIQDQLQQWKQKWGQ